MKRVTFKIPEDWKNELDERADEAGDSRSEVLRKIVDDALHTPEDDGEQERLRREVEELQTEVERLKNEKRQILEQREENQELVEYVEAEKSLVEEQAERKQAPVWQRAKWWVMGTPE